MSAITLSLGGITFNGGADGNGVRYRVTRFEGWDGHEMRQSVHERVGAGGVVITESQRGPRPIVLEGWVIAPTYPALWAGMNSLTAAVDLVTADGTLVVNEPTPKQVAVRLAGRLKMQWRSSNTAEFSVPLLAADPTKYAVSETSTPLA